MKAYLLHYETVADLLSECVSYMNEHFLSYMKKDSSAFAIKLRTCPLEELYIITPILERYGVAEHDRPYILAFVTIQSHAKSDKYDRNACIPEHI